MSNPKIIHRIYFENFAPFHDPYEHYLESWYREMPDYKIMKWGFENLDVNENEWTRRASAAGAPVFLAEYFRWKVLSEYGGLYLDADCEIIDGPALSGLLDQLWNQDGYDSFFGVEERANGHPTAQTIAAKKGSGLVDFMKGLYEDSLAPFWRWRETRGLIGPQLMSLYFGDDAKDDGFFRDLDAPVVVGNSKIYPQHYFSPKFAILGDKIDFRPGETCVYHMFANANVDFSKLKRLRTAREKAMTFAEYTSYLESANFSGFPRSYDAAHFTASIGEYADEGIIAGGSDGLVCYGPYIELPRGRYRARWKFGRIADSGSVVVKVTCDTGSVDIAEASFDLTLQRGQEISVDFSIGDEKVSMIEFPLVISNVESLKLDAVVIEQREDLPAALPLAPAVPKSSSLKVLHRIYFGFDGKEDGYLRYLDSWREQLPDFEILHWNASNLPMDCNPYVKKLYAEKDHAFLTDYFRWYLLREFGGSYLDADVEIVNGDIYRSLIEDLERQDEIEAFIGIDEKSGGWYTAHSMASKPGSDIATFMCSVYEGFGGFAAWRKKGFYFWAPQLTALYFANRGHNVAGMGTSPWLEEPVVTAGVKIYPQEWFAPLAPTGKSDEPFVLSALTDNSCICHHFACSWHEGDSIYLSHSREKGGQSNIFLKEIIENQKLLSYPAADERIRTVVGSRSDGGVISTTGRRGCLSFGPYLALSTGQYRAIFHCRDIAALGSASIDVVTSNGDLYILKPVDAGIGRDGSILSVEFSVPEPASDLEVRLHVSETSDLALSSLQIERLSAGV